MSGSNKIFTKTEAEQEVRGRTGLEPGEDGFNEEFLCSFVPYNGSRCFFLENEFRDKFPCSHGRSHLGNELSRALSEIS